MHSNETSGRVKKNYKLSLLYRSGLYKLIINYNTVCNPFNNNDLSIMLNIIYKAKKKEKCCTTFKNQSGKTI